MRISRWQWRRGMEDMYSHFLLRSKSWVWDRRTRRMQRRVERKSTVWIISWEYIDICYAMYTYGTPGTTRITTWYWGVSPAMPWGNIHSTSGGATSSTSTNPGIQPGRTCSLPNSYSQLRDPWYGRRITTPGYLITHGKSLIWESPCAGIQSRTRGACGTSVDRLETACNRTDTGGWRWTGWTFNPSLPPTFFLWKRCGIG